MTRVLEFDRVSQKIEKDLLQSPLVKQKLSNRVFASVVDFKIFAEC